jgi:hypothetical protein
MLTGTIPKNNNMESKALSLDEAAKEKQNEIQRVFALAENHVKEVKKAALNLGLELNEGAAAGHQSGYFKGYNDGAEWQQNQHKPEQGVNNEPKTHIIIPNEDFEFIIIAVNGEIARYDEIEKAGGEQGKRASYQKQKYQEIERLFVDLFKNLKQISYPSEITKQIIEKTKSF